MGLAGSMSTPEPKGCGGVSAQRCDEFRILARCKTLEHSACAQPHAQSQLFHAAAVRAVAAVGELDRSAIRARARERFDRDTMVDRYCDLYDEVVAPGSARARTVQ